MEPRNLFNKIFVAIGAIGEKNGQELLYILICSSHSTSDSSEMESTLTLYVVLVHCYGIDITLSYTTVRV